MSVSQPEGLNVGRLKELNLSTFVDWCFSISICLALRLCSYYYMHLDVGGCKSVKGAYFQDSIDLSLQNRINAGLSDNFNVFTCKYNLPF